MFRFYTSMRLEKIKLAGFKSFVDPTTVPLTSNLVAVVGPNGCGKSNIIDAVRWVMGESSAKYLRGESITDVIFNGSSTRKPVGQAAVELIFDNSDAKITGEFARYNQISIKREVNREAQSTYYINNTRCRRKDITDIFLGTGLGPRSYSIIEQGMISRVIEAKPEELRAYLEEAAGISKYKERRRETETRIRHTRENLERLTDIRDELGKQLDKLQRQAKAAEKYKILKQEERLLKAQLYALRWQALNEQVQSQSQYIKQQELELEALNTKHQGIETDIETSRQKHSDKTQVFNEVQARYYQLGAQIARLEEAIAHSREKREQMQQDLGQIETDLAALKQLIDNDNTQWVTIRHEIQSLEPNVKQQTQIISDAQNNLAQVEKQREVWQGTWDEFTQTAAKSSEQAHIEQTRIQQLEQQLNALNKQITQLKEEQGSISQVELNQAITDLTTQVDSTGSQLTEQQSRLQTLNSNIASGRDAVLAQSNALDTIRNELQTLRGRQASLQALQQAALGKQSGKMLTWLEQNALADKPRLAEGLSVSDGWDKAVETVLGSYLQAVCVEGIDVTESFFQALPEGECILFDTQIIQQPSEPLGSVSLATKVSSDFSSVPHLLNDVLLADDLNHAARLRHRLSSHQSVITKDGIWLGKAWLRIAKGHDEKAGVLQREQELKSLTRTIEDKRLVAQETETQLDTLRERLEQNEQQRDQQQHRVTEINSAIADINAQLRVKQLRLEQSLRRQQQIEEQLSDFTQQTSELNAHISNARDTWQNAMQAMNSDADKREALGHQRNDINQGLQLAQDKLRQAQDTFHQSTIQLQTYQTQGNALKQQIERSTQRQAQLIERQAAIKTAFDHDQNPEQDLDQNLADKLAKHVEIESELKQARTALETLEQALNNLEKQRQQIDQDIRAQQAKVEQLRLDSQGIQVRCQTVQEQIDETDFTLEYLLNELPEEANSSVWETNVEQLANRISRLGAINLAAIDEYETESERKQYLDTQDEDLNNALETLEAAIKKFDSETRTRFKETYEKVNDSFKTLFPSLFGGGQAYLELTGHDLLDTGVVVLARPPGKRNSTIHLLSGGEKALTAVALVFAIFQLNPSPFCMLDEVDAPLDDTNVARFCDTVKSMSSDVQFIFITHNKITMELADHLSGVTMHEPGVSRMVSVDVDEAISMVGA